MRLYRNEKAGKMICDTYDTLLGMWGVGKEERDVATTYGDTHVVLCGVEGAPPLVLFHGVGDDSALMWLYNAAALAQHFRVVAVDTIGGPGKSRPNARYAEGFDDAQWIDEVLDGLGLGTVFIAGVSNGAYLAQYYALHRHTRVPKILCMAGGVPVGDSGPMKTMMKIFLPEALFPTKANTIKLLKKLCGENSAVFTDEPVVLAHYQALLRGFNNMAMRWHKIERFSDVQVDAIRGRALYLMGEADPFARLGGKDALLRCRMNARFYPGVGHGLNHEAAARANAAMIEYFSA